MVSPAYQPARLASSVMAAVATAGEYRHSHFARGQFNNDVSLLRLDELDGQQLLIWRSERSLRKLPHDRIAVVLMPH